MPASDNFASDLVASGASGYGTAAAHALLERHPETAERFGDGAFRGWSRHLTERTLELAAAMLVHEPRLFAAEVDWARASFDAREVPLDDLTASLECLREVLAAELPDTVRAFPEPYFDAALRRLAQPAPERAPLESAEGPDARLVLEYLEAALSGRRREAIDRILAAVDDGLAVETVLSDVLCNAQTLVGEMWHAHELSVAQEHFVTSTTEAVMTLLAHRTPPPAPDAPTVVVALAPGNSHGLGARSLTHLLERDGWNAIYVGADMPAAEAAIALEAFDAGLLAISVAMSVQLRATVNLVRHVRASRPDLKVLAGGRIFGAVPELWRKIDCDGSAADAVQAIAAARALLGD